MSHDTIFIEILVLGATGLATWAVIQFKVGLMWKEYQHRHKMNGDDEK